MTTREDGGEGRMLTSARRRPWARITRWTAVLVALSSCGTTAAWGQADEGKLEAQVSSFAAPFVANRDFEGVVLVHRSGGHDVFVSFSGDGGSAPRYTSRTPFLVGSVTKTFTAEAVRQLVADGRLALSDRASRFLPELPWGDSITVEQLLNHSAGVPDYYAVPDFRKVRADPMPLDRFVTWISRFPLDFTPGSRDSYSNSGYNLLAAIVERLAGMPYGAFLERGTFGPLAMKGAGTVGASPPSDLPPGLVGPPARLDPTWLLGSGSTYASTDDLARWGDEIIRRVRAGGWTPYGWGVRASGERKYLEQNGRIPGFASALEVFPSEGLVVVALSRVESDAVVHVANGCAALALGLPVTEGRRRTEVPLAPDAQEAYFGAYEMAPGFVLTVGRFGAGVGAAVGEGEDLDFGLLQPLGHDRFFFRQTYTEVGFTRDPDGAVTGLTWGGGGPYPRVRAAPRQPG